MTSSNSINHKVCAQCKTFKHFNQFPPRNEINSRCKRHSYCKSCMNLRTKSYKRTKNGLVSVIYRDQRNSSVKRNHVMPNYTLSELTEWMLSQSNFNFLYDNWVLSGHDKHIIPSCDRLDDCSPYTIDNIQLVTWGDNLNNARLKASKPVVQMALDGTFIAEYSSRNFATKEIGGGNVGGCCTGRQKTSGGYRWMNSLGIQIANNKKTGAYHV